MTPLSSVTPKETSLSEESSEPLSSNGFSAEANKSESVKMETPKAEVTPRPPIEDHGLFTSLSRWVKSNFGPKNDEMSVRDALEELLSNAPETDTPINPEERNILKNILAFGESDVIDIMIPRSDIVAVEVTIDLPELKQVILEERHTRIPVYRDTLDEVLGFVHIKDLIPVLCGDVEFDITRFTRQILFVPPSMKVVDLLVKMRLSGVHMAIVVDEYGGTDGLVTLENLFEEIVGDIQDEHDGDEPEPEKFHRINEHEIEIDAKLEIAELEEALGISLAEHAEEYGVDTVGGIIFSQLGRVPAVGEVVRHPSGLLFEVLEADMRRILRVKVSSLQKVSTEE